MARLDGTMNRKYRQMLAYTSQTDNTAIVGTIIDTADAAEVTLLVHIHAAADADTTITALLEDGDNSGLSDNAAVADAYLFGTEAGMALQFDSETKVAKIGYRGSKRYIRLTLTPANNTGSLTLSGIAVLGYTYKNANTTQLQTNAA